MRVLVFGTTGQVAREIARAASPDQQITALSRAQVDFTTPEACRAAVTQTPCDVVINAVAYTAVDQAEAEPDTAQVINATAPGVIAAACAEKDVPLIHISTDYVFDGSGQHAYRPGDPTGPLGTYGASKLTGEQAIKAAGVRALILRTSWVFSAHGSNFVKTMLRLSESRAALNIVNDQIGGPTPAADIAQACLTLARAMADGAPGGTYHFAGAPAVSWADFAAEIFAHAGRQVAITGIPTSEYPTPAKRPLNSRLDCADLRRDFGIPQPDWRAGLASVIKELT